MNRDSGSGLVLFFTRGMSLTTWDERGILERETAVYRRLAPRVEGVTFLTYGAGDRHFPDRLDGIDVVPKPAVLPDRAYGALLPALRASVLRRAGVLKTNQVYGGIAALRAAQLHRKPLVARCGFLWSEFASRQLPAGSLRLRAVLALQGRLFRGADVVQVTTDRMADEVLRLHRVSAERIVVVPNYVDTGAFSPSGEAPEERSLVFVGRLSPEKNLTALLEALSELEGVSLTIVGDGPQRGELEAAAQRLGVDARFAGTVPNHELPAVLRRASAFALPSLFEGHPKAALEAMACGLPVVGTDVRGIREVVRHGETGVLAETGAESLRAAVAELLDDDARRERMGHAARAVAQEVSLDRIVERELEVLERARAARARR